MMKGEFEQRIGLVITSEEYETIEAAYMGLPESVNKDKFVKIWLRNGGIQDLFDKRLAKANTLEEYRKNLYEENCDLRKWGHDLNEQCKKYREQIQVLKEKLGSISEIAEGVA